MEAGFAAGDQPGDSRRFPAGNIIEEIATAAAHNFPSAPAALLSALKVIQGGDKLSSDQQQQLRHEMIRLKGRQWSKAECAAALDLLMQSGDTERHTPAGDLAGRLAEADPGRLLELFSRASTEQRGDLPLNAAERITDQALQSKFLSLLGPSGLASGLGENPDAYPPELSAKIYDMLPKENRYEVLSSNIAFEWARTNPEAAAAWITSLGADPGSVEAAATLSQGWADYDDAAASAWAAALPPGPTRDGAAAGLALSLAPYDPDAAGSWAASIGTPDLSVSTHLSIAEKLGDKTPPDLRASLQRALEQAGASAEVRQRAAALLNPKPTPGTR